MKASRRLSALAIAILALGLRPASSTAQAPPAATAAPAASDARDEVRPLTADPPGEEKSPVPKAPEWAKAGQEWMSVPLPE